MMFRDLRIRAIGLAAAPSLLFIATSIAAERRAPAPSFSSDSFRGVFFAEPSQAIRGQRPRMGSIQAPAAVANAQAPSSAKPSEANAASGFSSLISPATLEDEIKRLRLEFDAGITTPAAFQSGGFQDARVRLTILASLFAIITEHNDEVRWKKDAPAARDLLARTALNCKSGSGQVYNEVKQRKNDLEDLVAGTGLANRQAEAENDWSMIADRVPLMIYMESLLEGPLKEGTRDAAAVKSQADQLRRAAQLIAAAGEILTKEGLADADEAEYAELCREMIKAAGDIVLALDQGDAAAVSTAVGTVSQTCAKCHETYR
ncbi:MAG: cytochrome c [Planctomycetaceae bacterium]